MFFEGSEKKIEMIFDRSLPSLRQRPEAFWAEVVAASQAQILSKVTNSQMDAYLLSESSLFVYDHYLVMITCGTTQLINAAAFLMSEFRPEQIQAFFYERKNELLPQAQKTDFFKDREILKQWFDGEALRYGREDEHHLYLFAANKPYVPASNDHTMEVLMHGIAPSVVEKFCGRNPEQAAELREETGINTIVAGQIDDYVFEPVGYSLNSIDEDRYYTIHVTPESQGSYISFETNGIALNNQVQHALKVINVFQPISFDLVLFNTQKVETPEFEGYLLKRQYAETLVSGYQTQYFSFYKPNQDEQRPTRLS